MVRAGPRGGGPRRPRAANHRAAGCDAGVRAQPAGANGGAAANGSEEGTEAPVMGGRPNQSQCGGRGGVLRGAELTRLWANRSVAEGAGFVAMVPRARSGPSALRPAGRRSG